MSVQYEDDRADGDASRQEVEVEEAESQYHEPDMAAVGEGEAH